MVMTFIFVIAIISVIGYVFASRKDEGATQLTPKFQAPIDKAGSQIVSQVIEREKVIEREIVKVKCRYCGALNNQTAQKCSSCGAVL
jgi:ribosomal protein L40E